jgi:hypothetical protein
MPDLQPAQEFLNTDDIGVKLAIAVNGFFVLFFLISPLLGGVIHRGVRNRWALSVGTAMALLVFNIVFLGLNYLLRGAFTREMATTPQLVDPITITGLIAGLIAGLLVGAGLWWYFTKPPSQLDREAAALQASEITSPTDERRLARIQKRGTAARRR